MKSQVTSMHDLQAKISQLEALQVQQVEDIKDGMQDVMHSLKPLNLIKNVIGTFAESSRIHHDEIDTVIGKGAGLLSYNLYVRGSRNIFKRMAGKALQFLVSNYVQNKIPDIRERIAAH